MLETLAKINAFPMPKLGDPHQNSIQPKQPLHCRQPHEEHDDLIQRDHELPAGYDADGVVNNAFTHRAGRGRDPETLYEKEP